LAFLVGGEISSTIEHAAAEHGHPEAKAEGQKAALRLIRSGCEISMAHLGILCRVGTQLSVYEFVMSLATTLRTRLFGT